MLAAPAVAWLLAGCTTVSLPTIPYGAADVTVISSLPAYRIQVGFQLTPAELEVNRQRGQR